MQVGLGKRWKSGWVQELFTTLTSSTILCKSIQNTQTSWKNQFKIQSKSQENILRPPDVEFRIDSKLIIKLKQKLQRTRKNIQGIIVAQSLNLPINNFVELKNHDQEDLGALQQTQGVFCVGVTLTKGEGDSQTYRRIKEQLRKCSERSGAIFSHNSKNSQLSQISKTIARLVRIFIIMDDSKQGLTIGKLIFFPKVNIPIRKIKIEKCSFTFNQVLKMITTQLNFNKDIAFGYISLNNSPNGFKFILLDKNDPELQNNPPPVLGVWVAGNIGNNAQRYNNFWIAIMEYLTNPQITKRLSLQGESTGLLFVFENPRMNTQYIFQFPNNARWSISSQLQNTNKIPQEYSFSQQEVIMEQQKQQSQVQSISSKQEKMNKQGFQSQQSTQQSKIIQEKDAQIRRLKIQLQFYKAQYQKLQETLLQHATRTYANNIPPPNSYKNNYSPPKQQIPAHNDVPFFGKKAQSIQFEEDLGGKKLKQFTVRDMKNISFAQQNSFEEQNIASSIFEKQLDFKFTTPQFKQTKQSKPVPSKDIKSFNFIKKSEENKDQSNISSLKNKISIKQDQKDKEKNHLQEDKDANLTNIKNFSEKYGNSYKGIDKAQSSPQIPEKIIQKQPKRIEIEQKQQIYKKPSFQQSSRQKRIKNELYSQSPIKKIPQAQSSKANQQYQTKVQENKSSRSKSPITSPPSKRQIISSKSAIQSDDQDDELKNILQRRGKKK